MRKKHNRRIRKWLSLFLTAAMFFTMQGMPVLAETVGQLTEARSASPANPVHTCTKQSGGSDCTEWSYVYFGSYPQSEVTGEALTVAITGASYDSNGDAWVNGIKYRRISKEDTNNTDYFGSSEYRYFKWERIKWRVLKNNGSTLFVAADKGLDCKDYNEVRESITWENCTLRSWLNQDFYNTAFNGSEQGAIIEQTGVNEDNPYYNTEGGNDTRDKVFLLSIGEVTNPDYGFCEDYSTYFASRWVQPSDYAHARGAYTYSSDSYTDGNANGWWWLRSPGDYTNCAAYVYSTGNVSELGPYVDNDNGSCVPALHINLSSDLWSAADDGSSGEGGGSGTGDGDNEPGGNSGEGGNGTGEEEPGNPSSITIDGYTVYVTDTSGAPIYNASVLIGVDSASTDRDGKAEFSSVKAYKDEKGSLTFNITVQAGGYSKYTGYNYAVSDSRVTYITMLTIGEAADENSFSLLKNDSFESVLFKDALFGNIDLMVNQKTISLSEPEEIFDLTVNVKEETKAYVKKYYILSGNKKVMESDTGEFQDVAYSLFEAGKKVYIMLDIDPGTGEIKRATTERQQINLSVKNPSESVKNTYGSLSFGENLTFTAPANTPFIGGQEFNLAKLNLPIDLKLGTDGNFVLSINTDDEALIDKNYLLFTDPDKDKVKKEVKEKEVLDESLLGMYRSAIAKSSESLANGKEENAFEDKEVKFSDSLKFTAKIGGYISGKLNDSVKKGTGCLYIQIKASYKAEGNFLVMEIPLTASIEVGASGKASATIAVDFTDSSKSIGESVDGEVLMSVSPYVKLAAGPGCKEVNLKLTGGFSVPVDYYMLGENQGLQSVLLQLNAGISGKMFCWEHEWQLISGEVKVYTRPETAGSNGRMLYQGQNPVSMLYDAAELTMPDYSGVLAGRAWNASSVKMSGSAVLNPAVSNYADTKTVRAGDTVLMVWQDADIDREAYNADTLYYSLYDTSTGIWQSPEQVDGNDTADFDFDLYTDGEDIYLAYQEMSRKFTAEDGISDMAAATRIVFAKFDAAEHSFTDFEILADGGQYVMSPSIVKNGPALTVFWTENTAMDYYALNNTNAVAMKSFQNGVWSGRERLLEDSCKICEIQGCVLDGKTYLAYILDMDNDLSTTKDRNVLLLDLEGKTTAVTTDDVLNANLVYDASAGEDALYWYQDDTIVLLKSADGQPKEAVSGLDINPNESFTIVSGEGSQAILFTQNDMDLEEDIVEAYVMYKQPDGTYGRPVQVTEETSYISGCSGAIVDGAVLLAYRQDAYEYGADDIEVSSSLRSSLVCDFSKISMANLDYDYDEMKAGDRIPMTADITNQGSHPVTMLDLFVYSPSNEKLQQSQVSVELGVGETKTVSLDVAIPETLEAGSYILKLSESGAEEEGAASGEFTLLYADLSLSAEVITLGENTYVSAVVENGGDLAADAVVTLVNQENPEKILSSHPLEGIAAGAYQTALIPVTGEMLTQDSLYSDFTVSVSTDAEEAYQYNNSAAVQVESRVKSMSLDPESLEMKQGDTKMLSVHINAFGTPEFAYEWKSSDGLVARVDAEGTVTAIGSGEAVITVLTEQGDFAECRVKVTEKSEPTPEDPEVKPEPTPEDPEVKPEPTPEDPEVKPDLKPENPDESSDKEPSAEGGPSVNGEASKIVPKGTAIKGKVKAGTKGFLVKWKKQKGITGYQLQVSANKKFKKKNTITKTVKKASKTKLMVKKLKAKKKYYVRIRTYHTVNGTKYYSKWSKAKSVRTK